MHISITCHQNSRHGDRYSVQQEEASSWSPEFGQGHGMHNGTRCAVWTRPHFHCFGLYDPKRRQESEATLWQLCLCTRTHFFPSHLRPPLSEANASSNTHSHEFDFVYRFSFTVSALGTTPATIINNHTRENWRPTSRLCEIHDWLD